MSSTHEKNTWSNQKKKQLIMSVNDLCLTEHIEIFKIISKNDTNYTKNNNGIFINLSSLNDYQLEEISSFIDFCIKNKIDLDEYDKKLQECKANNNYNLIVNSLPLNNIINEENAKVIKDSEERIQDQLNSIQKNEKLTSFISYIEDSVENIHKKKTNLKYFNAKKKYSRKINIEKKADYVDFVSTLFYDNPIF